jgi:hypothetical protein
MAFPSRDPILQLVERFVAGCATAALEECGLLDDPEEEAEEEIGV